MWINEIKPGYNPIKHRRYATNTYHPFKNNICKCILGNDESDDSEESHDEDEEEDAPTSYSPTRNNNELEPDSLDDLNEAPDLNTSDQSALWAIQ